jgi:hypothetical protein
MAVLLKEVFNFYMPICGNSVPKQKTVYSAMDCNVHVVTYNAAKQMFMC